LVVGFFLGPFIRESLKPRSFQYIKLGDKEAAQLISAGRKDKIAHAFGYFIRLTFLYQLTIVLTIWQDDIFVVVLSISLVKNLVETISLTNQSRFANGACIFTNDGGNVRTFRETIDAGMLGVNIGVPAPMAFFPFSGWKDSFYGDLHTNGKDGLEF